MRLFIAVDVSDEVKQMIAQSLLLSREISGVVWTTRDQWHITLAFLGDVELERVAVLDRELGTIRTGCFALDVEGTGVFPDWGSPRVFWAGVSAEEGLFVLHRAVWDVLQGLGFVPEGREFHPHLTLARIKKPLSSQEKEMLRALKLARKNTQVTQFHLYKSELYRQGAVYTRLASYELEGAHHG